MKKFVLGFYRYVVLFGFAVFLGGGLFANAASFVSPDPFTEIVNGMEWTFLVSNGVAWVGGGMSESVPPGAAVENVKIVTAIDPFIEGHVEIPDVLGGFPVRGVSPGAFYRSRVTSISIPKDVADIGESAFRNCDRLTSITIPVSVTTIGEGAFFDCYELETVTADPKWTVSEFHAFREVRTFIVPDGVCEIAEWAFKNCNDLRSVTIPNSVTNIGHGAFRDAYDLQEIHIPDLASWSHVVFRTLLLPHRLYVGDTEVTNLIVPRGVSEIGIGSFNGLGNLTSLSIPDSVESVGNYAFYNCTGLTSIVIPGSVKTIGAGSFDGCSQLYAVGIGSGVVSIGERAFFDCDNLKKIMIPESVEHIAEEAFSSSLELMVLPKRFKEMDYRKFVEESWGASCRFEFYPPEVAPSTGSTIPGEWLHIKAATILEAHGGDYEAAANAPAANGVNKVWECYVAGIDPTDEEARFEATIEIGADGKPEVKWNPPLSEEEAAKRTYRTYGRKTLDPKEGWTDVTDVEDLDAAGWKFFKAAVEMK